jgi:hypothetical protein
VKSLNQQAFQAVYQATLPEIKALAEYEGSYQFKLFQSAIPNAIQVKFPVSAVSEEQVYAAALSRPFQGRLLKDWYTNLGDTRMALMRNAIRNGYVQGQTTDQIVRSIRGTKKQNYADGFLDRSRRETEAVVRTALSHTAQTARTQFEQNNADIIAAVKWLSTLDSHTTPQCRIRDGLRYTLTEHKPIGHGVPWLQGPGRLHFGCRSTSTVITKSWKDLGFSADELPASTRASMNGQVPADQTYNEWLAKQPASVQLDVLGSTRYQLYKKGNLSLDKFYNDKGTWLSLDDLKKRDAEAFSRAGVD